MGLRGFYRARPKNKGDLFPPGRLLRAGGPPCLGVLCAGDPPCLGLLCAGDPPRPGQGAPVLATGVFGWPGHPSREGIGGGAAAPGGGRLPGWRGAAGVAFGAGGAFAESWQWRFGQWPCPCGRMANPNLALTPSHPRLGGVAQRAGVGSR